MSDKPEGHGNITVGDIIGSQGTAIGPHATATVTGHNVTGDVKIDAGQLRTALEELYDALGQGGLPREKARSTQTAAGNAIEAVTEKEVKSDTVVSNVKKIGETLKEANVAVQEGSSLWESVKKLSSVIGPLVGGARVVAGWFGVSF
jgi:hypothetical protein